MEQRSAEWFAARKGKITGSRIGAILGVNQYQTRDDVMRSMVREWFDAPSEFTGNAATDHGTAMEPHAIAFYREKMLLDEVEDVEEVGFIPHPRLEYVGASPDGILKMKPGTNWRGGLEIKCPYYAKVPYSVFDPKKASYLAQCQLVMEVCGLDRMDFLCYFDDENYLIETVDRDYGWWHVVEPKLEAFYAEFQAIIRNKKKAEPYLRDGDPEVDDARVGKLAKLYFEIKTIEEQLKPLKADFDKLKKDVTAEYPVGTGDGIRFATQTKKGAIDWAKVADDLDVADLLKDIGKSLDDYRKPETTSIIVEASK